jgi:hypothetical protein
VQGVDPLNPHCFVLKVLMSPSLSSHPLHPADLPKCPLSDILESFVAHVPLYGSGITVRVVNISIDNSETKPMFRGRSDTAHGKTELICV